MGRVRPEPTHGSAKPAGIRRHMIVERLLAGGYVGVAELAREFDVTEVTIRSDLDIIGTRHDVHRVRGGAVYRNHHRGEPTYEESIRSNGEQKQAIAERAANLVNSGDTLILDAGTTTMCLANALAQRTDLTDVVVLTNSLPIAMALDSVIPRFQVVVTGGSLRSQQHSLVAPFASEVLRLFHADLVFIGCTGMDIKGGATNINLPETELKRAMLSAAKRGVVLADSTKFGHIDRGHIARGPDLWGVVTDVDALPLQSEYQRMGINLIVAS